MMHFSHFGLINTPFVFFFAFSSLLSLSFSPCLSLLDLCLFCHRPEPRSHWQPWLQQRAIVDFHGLLADSRRGPETHSQLCPFLGVSAAEVDEKYTYLPELLICLPLTYSLRPIAWPSFAPPPKGSRFIIVTDSSRFSLFFFLFL